MTAASRIGSLSASALSETLVHIPATQSGRCSPMDLTNWVNWNIKSKAIKNDLQLWWTGPYLNTPSIRELGSFLLLFVDYVPWENFFKIIIMTYRNKTPIIALTPTPAGFSTARLSSGVMMTGCLIPSLVSRWLEIIWNWQSETLQMKWKKAANSEGILSFNTNSGSPN